MKVKLTRTSDPPDAGVIPEPAAQALDFKFGRPISVGRVVFRHLIDAAHGRFTSAAVRFQRSCPPTGQPT